MPPYQKVRLQRSKGTTGLIREYRDADAAAVASLLQAAPELPSTSKESFRSFAALSFNRSARDFRVLREGARCLGVMTSTLLDDGPRPLRHFRIAIHPEHRRRGLASKLMDALQEQDAPQGTLLQCNSHATWLSGNGFLEHHGFAVAHTEVLMRRAADAATPERVAVPMDFTLRPATPSDDAIWAQLHRQAYGHRDDFSELTTEDLDAERASPGFTLTVVEHFGEVVGYCHAMDLEAGQGLVNSLVVRADMLRQGLGAVLLHQAAARLSAHGATQISLNVVSDNRAAIALYNMLGFATYDEMLTYQRPADVGTVAS